MTVEERLIVNELAEPTAHVRAGDLLSAFDYYLDKIQLLSLDCFDTLLWRKTATPVDMFYDLQHRPAFIANQITATHRYDAEVEVRQLTYINSGHHEVKLNEIYQHAFPKLDVSQINALVEDELATEMATCYAFPPVLELIRKAHANNIKITIVSNTYLSNLQLRRLLEHCLPADVFELIDSIFCSCDYRLTKNAGLFKQVLQHYPIPSQSILHIGDNALADLQGAKQHGLRALHLIQFDKNIAELQRMQTVAGMLIEPAFRYKRAFPNPFAGLFASAKLKTDQPESVIGYMSMGPIMYAFAQFLCDEHDQMLHNGKRPKFVFLMRDAYLLALSATAYHGKPLGELIEISRFTATAASFYSRADIDRYLTKHIHLYPLHVLGHQLLLPNDTVTALISRAQQCADPIYEFTQLIHQDDILQMILTTATMYRTRLINYFKNQVRITADETLVFVDIGYLGSVQRLLTPILEKELGIADIQGRYLITLNTIHWQESRRGLIDPSCCDDRLVKTLADNIGIIEELCCNGGGSVYDYDEAGNVLCCDSDISNNQLAKMQSVQSECLRFITDAKRFFKAANTTVSTQLLREVALAELQRRLYLPSAIEVQYLEAFQHDMNSGMKGATYIFESAAKDFVSLRRQGLIFKNQNPFGLRAAGLELAITLMAQRRFNFEVNLEDLSLRRENINVIMIENNTPKTYLFSATPTHDGYFALPIPINQSHKQIGIVFGMHYESLQVDSIELIRAHAYLGETENRHVIDVRPKSIFHQMLEKSGKFIECQATGSAIMITPNYPDSDQYILRIVFRPIQLRTC